VELPKTRKAAAGQGRRQQLSSGPPVNVQKKGNG